MDRGRGVSFSKWPIELVCWVGALILLYCASPDAHHHTLCPLGAAGLSWCPGCGLGRSISLLMHGDIMGSVQMHVLGIPAFGVLLFRIYTLVRNESRILKKETYGSS